MNSSSHHLPPSLTLLPSWFTWIGCLAAYAVMFAALIYVIVDFPAVAPGIFAWWRWFHMILCGLLVLFAIVSLAPGGNSLPITENGFTLRSLFRSWYVPWSAVAEVGVEKLSLCGPFTILIAGVVITPEWKSRARWRKHPNTEFDLIIPHGSGLSQNAMAELLTRYWEAWREKNGVVNSEQSTVLADDDT